MPISDHLVDAEPSANDTFRTIIQLFIRILPIPDRLPIELQNKFCMMQLFICVILLQLRYTRKI